MSFQPVSLSDSAPASNPKPVIICLHGGGTNGSIFNIQTIRLQRALEGVFEFEFLDALVESPPGPGVMPYFEGGGPFYRWGDHASGALNPGVKPKISAVISSILHGTGEHASSGPREVVGVLGFSQGGRCAAGLLLEQELGVALSPEEGFRGFQFGVFLNSTSPPLLSKALGAEERARRVHLRGVHVVGTDDPWRDEGVKLHSESFDPESNVLIELHCGHRLPIEQEDTDRIVTEIKRVWDEVRGREAETRTAA